MTEHDTAEDNQGISIFAEDPRKYLGGTDRVWKRIDPAILRKNLEDLVAGLFQSIAPSDAGSAFEVSEVSVAVTIGAGGEVGILGTGVSVSAEASLTLTLSPRK